MNAAFLVLTSALAAGSDVTLIGWGENAPAIVQAGGCSSCGAAPSCCDPCASSRVKLLDKIKARCAPKCKSSCAPACDPCAAEKIGFLDKLKAHFASKKSCCAPAPTCCPPAPACAPAPTCAPACDPCAPAKVGFFDKLKARMGAKKSHCCAAPACDSCTSGCSSAAGAAPAVVVPVNPPKEMPKVKEPAKDAPKSGATGIIIPQPVAAPAPVALPSLPVVPSSAVKLSGSSSPY